MAKIAIIGAGRVGTAVAKILLSISEHEVLLYDTSERALERAYKECDSIQRTEIQRLMSALPLTIAQISNDLEELLSEQKPNVIVSAAPFFECARIAEIALRLSCHYIDFTEDVAVSAAIHALAPTTVTFVPQTGLAPGLVSYIGLSLFEELGEPLSLALRVGALPQVAFSPTQYAITWSPEGLVNEYLKPTLRKVQNIIEEVPPLDDHEEIVVHGARYEAFTTAGGVGDLEAYDSIPSVEYKTIRYPGHLEFLQKLLQRVSYDFDDAVELFRQTFQRTRDDTVLLIAHAVDTENDSITASLSFYPCQNPSLTALELTTAGTGVGIIELLLANELPLGVLRPNQIGLEKLMQTAAMQLVFEHSS